uniref:ADAM metallopeptidase with thrombospondin type 1 motif 9 n=1 Tax=Rousettus aegyptiacus TaxID=9407 RepID=A0A7J8HM12_ROUAE|nr:ADAM metallopeptidase with thrombospondin type 1 motif 9 [Rousettus aegyptiacus]
MPDLSLHCSLSPSSGRLGRTRLSFIPRRKQNSSTVSTKAMSIPSPSTQRLSAFAQECWAHSGPMMGIILLNHYCPLMNKKKRNKTNPTLSIGAVPPTESPQQEGMHVTPQHLLHPIFEFRCRRLRTVGKNLGIWHSSPAAIRVMDQKVMETSEIR